MKKLSLNQKNTAATVGIIIILLLSVAAVYLAFIFLRLTIAFLDPEALLVESNIGYYWILPIMIFMMGSAAYITNKLRYDDIPLPIFSPEKKEGIQYPTHRKKHIIERIRRKKLLTALCISLALAVSITCFVLGIFNRVSMNSDGSIHCYNCFNVQTEEYSLEDLDEVEICINEMTTSSWIKTASYDFGITVRAKNGNVFNFLSENDTEYMLKIKNIVPKEILVIKGKENLNAIIDYYQFEGKDTKLIYELFDAE